MYTDPISTLKQATEKITDSINAGFSPTEALEKVAREEDLNVHMIKRATEVINVALTYDHMKKHADAKDAYFPIADAQKVCENIFGQTIKTANQKRTDWFPTVEEEPLNFRKLLKSGKTREMILKIASCEDEQNVMSLNGLMDKAANVLNNFEKEIDNSQTAVVYEKQAIAESFMDLIRKFAQDKNYRTSFEEFESQVYSTHGEEAVPYIDLLHKLGELTEDRGVHDDKYKLFDTCKEAELFQTLLDHGKAFNKYSQELKVLEQEYIEAKDKRAELFRFIKQSNAVEPRVEITEVTKVAEDVYVEPDPVMEAAKEKLATANYIITEEDQSKYLTEGQRICLPDTLKRTIINSKKNRSKLAFDMAETLMGKLKGDSELSPGIANTPDDDLERKLMLQELIVTDPILSAVPPKQVIDAYEQFLHLAPELSKEKGIVQSHLRQMVNSQALSAFDAKQLIDTNSGLLKQRMAQEGKPQPKFDNK